MLKKSRNIKLTMCVCRSNNGSINDLNMETNSGIIELAGSISLVLDNA